MALASLAGNGAALVTIANSKIIADGVLWVRVAAIVAVAVFLLGVATAFLMIASQRTHHIVRSWYFSKKTLRIDFDKNFVGSMSEQDVIEFRGLLEKDLASTDRAAAHHGDMAERNLSRSILASIIGLLFLVAILFLAPRAPIPPPVTSSATVNQYH